VAGLVRLPPVLLAEDGVFFLLERNELGFVSAAIPGEPFDHKNLPTDVGVVAEGLELDQYSIVALEFRRKRLVDIVELLVLHPLLEDCGLEPAKAGHDLLRCEIERHLDSELSTVKKPGISFAE